MVRVKRPIGIIDVSLVRTARRYCTVKIKAGRQTLTAADPLPDDLRDALAKIGRAGAH
jgi:hypothetical protein